MIQIMRVYNPIRRNIKIIFHVARLLQHNIRKNIP